MSTARFPALAGFVRAWILVAVWPGAVGIALADTAGQAAPGTPPAPPPVGRLEIDGKLIQVLTLQNRVGNVLELRRPARIVTLPPGEYRVLAVCLQGDCRSYAPVQPSDDDWFTLSPGTSHRLRVGAPLTGIVKAERHGTSLTLGYAVLDAAGREYSLARCKSPEYTISQGGRVLASGTLEFG